MRIKSCALARRILNGVLDERSPVLRLAPDVVVYDAETDHDARHQHAVIHVLRRGGRRRGPKAPKEDEEDVETGKDVVDDADNTRDAPRAPLEWGLYDFIVIVSDGMANRLRN